MKKLSLLCVVVLLVAVGCGPLFFQYTPTEKGYHIKTIYGPPLDGSREDGQKFLEKKATWLCPNGYEKISEKEIEGQTAWGSNNHQTHLLWEIECSASTAESAQ